MLLHVKRVFGLLILLLLISLVGMGCSRVVVKVPVLRPAEVNLGQKNRVAIGRISGSGGRMVASFIWDFLSQSDRIELISSRVGGTVKPSVLVEGDVTEYSYQEDIEEITKTCTRRIHRKDGSYYEEEYDCPEFRRVGYVSVQAYFRVIDAETGRLITSKSTSCEKNDRSIASPHYPPSIDSQAMFSTCCRDAAWELAKTIAPYTEMALAVFYRDRSLTVLNNGIVWAEIGRWDLAVKWFREAVLRVKEDHTIKREVAAKAYWNLGVALGYDGRFDEAEVQLQTACSMDRDMRCDQALNELLRLREERRRLKEQMGEPRPETKNQIPKETSHEKRESLGSRSYVGGDYSNRFDITPQRGFQDPGVGD